MIKGIYQETIKNLTWNISSILLVIRPSNQPVFSLHLCCYFNIEWSPPVCSLFWIHFKKFVLKGSNSVWTYFSFSHWNALDIFQSHLAIKELIYTMKWTDASLLEHIHLLAISLLSLGELENWALSVWLLNNWLTQRLGTGRRNFFN